VISAAADHIRPRSESNEDSSNASQISQVVHRPDNRRRSHRSACGHFFPSNKGRSEAALKGELCNIRKALQLTLGRSSSSAARAVKRPRDFHHFLPRAPVHKCKTAFSKTRLEHFRSENPRCQSAFPTYAANLITRYIYSYRLTRVITRLDTK
jgi:hypothetical protein